MATAYSNIGGSGARRSLIVPSSGGITWHGDGLPALTDGINNAGNAYWTAFTVSGSAWMMFDFLYPAIIDEAKWYQDAINAHGSWKWQGSNDNSTWTDIGVDFTLGGSATQTQTQLNGNTTAYRYYRLLGVSGTASVNPYLREIEFQITYNVNGVTPAYGNAGSSGDRQSIITVTADIGKGGGAWTDLINGSYTGSLYFNTTTYVVGLSIKFDFGVGANKLITEAIWYQNTSNTHGTWQWQGSNDNSNWSDIGSSFTLGGFAQVQTSLNGNTTGYRYYRLLGVSGSALNTPFLLEIDFKIGDASVTRDLTTACAAASAVSAPIAAITRPLASSPAAVSAVAGPILAITRALQATVAAGSVDSSPLLAVLRALASTPAGSTTGSTPNLAVERSLASSATIGSAVSTPNLLVQRALALFAAVMSATSDVNLSTQPVLATAIATQSQVSTPLLNVVRPLNSTGAGQAQTSAAVLAVLRTLTAAVASETQTSDITLKVLRELLTAIFGQSAVSTSVLILSLATEAHVTTDTSVGTLAVLRGLMVTIAVQSTLPDVYLAMGAYRDLITAIAAQAQTSVFDVTMAFHESLLAKAKRYYPIKTGVLEAAAKGYYGSVSGVDLKAAALSWAVTEEEKEANLPGDQYNDL